MAYGAEEPIDWDVRTARRTSQPNRKRHCTVRSIFADCTGATKSLRLVAELDQRVFAVGILR